MQHWRSRGVLRGWCLRRRQRWWHWGRLLHLHLQLPHLVIPYEGTRVRRQQHIDPPRANNHQPQKNIHSTPSSPRPSPWGPLQGDHSLSPPASYDKNTYNSNKNYTLTSSVTKLPLPVPPTPPPHTLPPPAPTSPKPTPPSSTPSSVQNTSSPHNPRTVTTPRQRLRPAPNS